MQSTLCVSVNSSVQTHKYGHILLCLAVTAQWNAQFQRQEHGRFKRVQYKRPSKRVHASLPVHGINTELDELFIFSTNQYRTDYPACTGELLAFGIQMTEAITSTDAMSFTEHGKKAKPVHRFRLFLQMARCFSPHQRTVVSYILRPQTSLTAYYGRAREKVR